jgi:pyridoxine 5-phosphate synthase
MLRLGVNIDHVATVRQARRAKEPDPVHAAILAELGGADGITVHLRGDRRHVQDRDVEVLRQTVRTRLNIEMASTQEMTRIALTVKPSQATLVPERREEVTTEGGLDVVLNSMQVRPTVKTLQDAGIEVSLFVDPELEQVKEAHKLDARAVEINTAAWSEAGDSRAREAALRKVTDAARFGRKLGLAVHAGHGLDYRNVAEIATSATPSWPGPSLSGWKGPCGRWRTRCGRRAAAGFDAFRESPYAEPTSMIEAYGRTDVGRRRKVNEDSFLVSPETSLYAVCDGMGGHNAGEVASRMAIETISAFITRSAVEKEITWPWGLDANLSFDANRLKTAIRLANARVFQAADNREELTGMGTTVVTALVSGDTMTVGSAGDSRCYLVRGGELKQLTRDDSWVSAALGEGILNSDDVERHPLRNVITKAVGARDAIDLDVLEHDLEPGDVVMLCSDGLHGMIGDQEIAKILKSSPDSLEETSARLVDAANEAGGRDNVTVVLLRRKE